MPASLARRTHSLGASTSGANVLALAWYSATGTGVENGSAGVPPAIGHDSSSPCWLTCPQRMNMPKRAARNHESSGTPGMVSLRTMLAAFSISPLGVGDSVSASVADAVRLVRESGLPNETNAMFTNVEGEWDEVMALIKACVDKVSESAPRVSVVIKIDHRPGVVDALHAKVAAVEAHLA